jgi:hypothetical protein
VIFASLLFQMSFTMTRITIQTQLTPIKSNMLLLLHICAIKPEILSRDSFIINIALYLILTNSFPYKNQYGLSWGIVLDK